MTHFNQRNINTKNRTKKNAELNLLYNAERIVSDVFPDIRRNEKVSLQMYGQKVHKLPVSGASKSSAPFMVPDFRSPPKETWRNDPV